MDKKFVLQSLEKYHMHNNFSSQISKFWPNEKCQKCTTINVKVVLGSNFVEWKIVKSTVFLSYSQSLSDRHQVPETKTKIAIMIEYGQEGERD